MLLIMLDAIQSRFIVLAKSWNAPINSNNYKLSRITWLHKSWTAKNGHLWKKLLWKSKNDNWTYTSFLISPNLHYLIMPSIQSLPTYIFVKDPKNWSFVIGQNDALSTWQERHLNLFFIMALAYCTTKVGVVKRGPCMCRAKRYVGTCM